MATGIRSILDGDAAETPQASYEPDIAGQLDSPLDELREILAKPDAAAGPELAQWLAERSPQDEALRLAAEMFRTALVAIMESPNPKYEAWVWAVVAGMECAAGMSMGELGKMFGVSKAAVSKAVNQRIDQFGLRRNGYVNSAEAREHHREAQLRLNRSLPDLPSVGGRQLHVYTIESVLVRFRGWYAAHSVSEGIDQWPTDRLHRVRDSLRPLAEFYRAVEQTMEWRG